MSTAIILNLVFIVLLSAAFITYQVLIGVAIGKVKKRVGKLEMDVKESIDDIYRGLDSVADEARRERDRQDSRFHDRFVELDENHHHEARALHDRIDETAENLQRAITDLLEDTNRRFEELEK